MLLFETIALEKIITLPSEIYYFFILFFGFAGLMVFIILSSLSINDFKKISFKENHYIDKKEKINFEEKHYNNIILSFFFYSGLSFLFGIVFLAKEYNFYQENKIINKNEYFETEEKLTNKYGNQPLYLKEVLIKKEILNLCEKYFLEKTKNTLNIVETSECLNLNYNNFKNYMDNFKNNKNFHLPSVNQDYNNFLKKHLKQEFGDKALVATLELDSVRDFLQKSEFFGEALVRKTIMNKNIQNMVLINYSDYEPLIFKVKK